MKKLTLAIAAATVSLAALAGGALILSGRAVAQEGGTAQSDGDKAFLKIVPGAPDPENADLVPHASPEEAAAIAKAFFETPRPSDAELATIAPFAGTGNVPASRCEGYEPNAVTDELTLAPPSIERRLKGEIYALLNAHRVLTTQDCGCGGKFAPWEPVQIIIDTLRKRSGSLSWSAVDQYRDEALRLRRVAERVCQGGFF